MQYIRNFFSDEFWNQRYLRFGSQACSGFAAVGVRLVRKHSSTVQKIKHDMVTGRELEADEWMPDVVSKGIVYHDRVTGLSGESEIARKAAKVRTEEEKMIDEITEGLAVKDMKRLKIGMREKMGSPGRSPIRSPRRSLASTTKKRTPRTPRTPRKS